MARHLTEVHPPILENCFHLPRPVDPIERNQLSDPQHSDLFAFQTNFSSIRLYDSSERSHCCHCNPSWYCRRWLSTGGFPFLIHHHPPRSIMRDFRPEGPSVLSSFEWPSLAYPTSNASSFSGDSAPSSTAVRSPTTIERLNWPGDPIPLTNSDLSAKLPFRCPSTFFSGSTESESNSAIATFWGLPFKAGSDTLLPSTESRRHPAGVEAVNGRFAPSQSLSSRAPSVR